VVSRGLLINFEIPLVSPERLKLETSNFVCMSRARDPIRKCAKVCHRGLRVGSRGQKTLLKPMEIVFTNISATDKAMIVKLQHNIRLVKP